MGKEMNNENCTDNNVQKKKMPFGIKLAIAAGVTTAGVGTVVCVRKFSVELCRQKMCTRIESLFDAEINTLNKYANTIHRYIDHNDIKDENLLKACVESAERADKVVDSIYNMRKTLISAVNNIDGKHFDILESRVNEFEIENEKLFKQLLDSLRVLINACNTHKQCNRYSEKYPNKASDDITPASESEQIHINEEKHDDASVSEEPVSENNDNDTVIETTQDDTDMQLILQEAQNNRENYKTYIKIITILDNYGLKDYNDYSDISNELESDEPTHVAHVKQLLDNMKDELTNSIKAMVNSMDRNDTDSKYMRIAAVTSNSNWNHMMEDMIGASSMKFIYDCIDHDDETMIAFCSKLAMDLIDDDWVNAQSPFIGADVESCIEELSKYFDKTIVEDNVHNIVSKSSYDDLMLVIGRMSDSDTKTN